MRDYNSVFCDQFLVAFCVKRRHFHPLKSVEGTLVLKQLDIGCSKESIKSTRSHWLVKSVDATSILRHQTKKGAGGLPFLFGYLSSPTYFGFSSFNFAVRAGKTSL
jgi:hypothetical protein